MSLIEEAESLLLYQFKNSKKLIGLIRSLVAPLEELDQQLQGLHHSRYIDEAQGERLDILGRLVNQPRHNKDDADFKAWIEATIRLNTGSGTPENVLGILGIFCQNPGDVLLKEHSPNQVFVIFLASLRTPLKALFAITRSALPVNIKCHFIKADLEPVFRFDLNPFADSALAEFFVE